MEIFHLDTLPHPRLIGTVLTAFEGTPAEVRYEVVCSQAWETRFVRVELLLPGRKRHLELTAPATGHWWCEGRPLDAVAGCPDVDLSVTPSTNLLPIRRLGLRPGQSAEVAAAWIRFPSLEPTVLPQRYTRLDEHRYRYESGGGAFTAELTVDDAGLPVRYGDLWETVAREPAAAAAATGHGGR
jgi:hypothetical protein